MAIVIILLSCALGAMAGLFQLIFLGASVGQAVLTYLAISVILPVALVGASLVLSFIRPARTLQEPLAQDDVETWQDWQTEEEMAADRGAATEQEAADETTLSRIEARHSA